MPTRIAPDPPRYDASVQRSVKNVHDREPLLIPQIFADRVPPWHRRRVNQVLLALIVLLLGAAALVVVRLGVGGTAARLGRLGTAILRAFANIAG